MIENPRIRIISGHDTYHLDIDKNIDESDIEAILANINTATQWHLENRNDHRHYPVYLNKLSDDTYQIYGAINGVSMKQHSGQHSGLWITSIQFFDYRKRQIKDTLLPEGNIANLYDKLIAIYKDEIEIPACEDKVRYLLYVSMNDHGQLAYIHEKIMNAHGFIPTTTLQFKHRAANLTDIGKEMNWMPNRIQKPSEPGVYQIVVDVTWSPLSARTMPVLSCTPICIF